MMGTANDLRARCWALYTDHNTRHDIKQVMLEVVQMIDFEQRREVNRKRGQERRAKETPEQAAVRREKNRLRMAAKRAAK